MFPAQEEKHDVVGGYRRTGAFITTNNACVLCCLLRVLLACWSDRALWCLDSYVIKKKTYVRLDRTKLLSNLRLFL